jgi:catechol 2,3-dioxygenase-like lactoylglutathione lyase family enzyme
MVADRGEQVPSTDGGSETVRERSALSVRATLISVKDLDVSVVFYQDVMGLCEVMRQDQIAVLRNEPSGKLDIILRVSGRSAFHRSGQQALGLRASSFDVGSFEELDRVERSLRTREAFLDRGSSGPPRRFEYVRGLDPDRQVLIFMAHSAGMEFSADHYQQIVGLMYGVDI